MDSARRCARRPATFLERLLVATMMSLLGGCVGAPPPVIAQKVETPPQAGTSVVRILTREGLERLGRHRYEDASRIFNAGLKFAPQDASLHFLNGLAYHLLYLRGDESRRELAATGYGLALEHEPAHFHAALQLGRLEFEAKRYERSAEAFRRATDIEPRHGAGHLGLAAAAYYARDLHAARDAIEQAVALMPGDPRAAGGAAMIHAALGEPAKARDAARRHAALEKDANARSRLDSRVEQWVAWHAQRPQPPRASAPELQLAQLGPPAEATPEPRRGATADAPVPSRPWFDCTGSASAERSYPTPSGADETVPMPSLPAPCAGAGLPRMVVLDVVFIRTENNSSDSHGVNLLEGLSYVLGAGRTVSDVVMGAGDTVGRQVTITRNRERGVKQEFGVRYSLNIANATDTRAEVLASPSLVALDRLPSTFFSGRNVTLGIAGQGSGASYVTDRPVGVSLSVTPTFVDAETLLLAVRAGRSFVEMVDEAVRFGSSLQTSKSTVLANVVLRMGQTLIVSGLSEQEVQRSTNGVPVLKDIPGLQYLFGTRIAQNFTTSVLVLITPRAAALDGDLMRGSVGYLDTLAQDKAAFRPLVEQALKRLPGSAPPSLEGTYRHALENKLYLQFRSGDLALQPWSEPSRLDSLLNDLRDLLHH